VNALLIKAGVVAVVAGSLLMAKCGYDGKRRAEGAAAVRDSIAAARIMMLERQRSWRDTLYVRDTVPKWRTVRMTETLIDTLLKSDTVVLTRRESVIVFAADSAIQACRSIVLGCEARVAVRDSLLTAITADRDVWRRRSSPSLITKATTALKWLGVGYLIGRTTK
jgi:hypothetical protein